MIAQRMRNAVILGQHYVIKNRIGRGSMSVVYRAEDRRADRDVAIKLLPRELLAEPELHEQFTSVAHTLTTLEHPNIVPVYGFGEHAGQPYLVMRYMGGVPLSGQLELGAISLAEAAYYVEQIASALNRAHRRGVIHGDLKPENVLFDSEGNLALSDFGLVRFAHPFAQVGSLSVAGSPGYVAPEIVRPDGYTPLIDIYALGVLLYRMLAGQLPYLASSPIETLRKHVHAPIPNLRVVRPDLPDGILPVINRALAKEPGDRYQTALELKDDLLAVIDEAGPRAAQIGASYQAFQRSDGSEEEADGSPYDTIPDWYRPGIDDLELMHSTVSTVEDYVARGQAEANPTSPDALPQRERRSRRLAERRALGRWRAAQARRRGLNEFFVRLAGLTFPPVATWLVVGVVIALFIIWFQVTGAYGAFTAAFEEVETPVPTSAPTPLPTPKPTPNAAIYHLAAHSGPVTVLAYDPAGVRLASGGEDGHIYLWDPATGEQIAHVGEHDAAVTDLAFTADGQRLASASLDGSVAVWNLVNGRRAQRLTGHVRPVNAVAWSPDGRWLASGGDDGVVLVSDLAGRSSAEGEQDVRWLDARSGPITALAFSPAGVLAAGTGEQIIYWVVETGRDIRRQDVGGLVRELSYAASGEALAVGTDAGFRVIDPVSGATIDAIPGLPLGDMAWAPDGLRVAVASGAPDMLVWDLTTGAPVRQLSGHEAGVSSVAWSPDGRWLATGALDAAIILWDLGLGSDVVTIPSTPISPDTVAQVELWRELRGHIDVIRALSFDSTGRRLASASQDGRLVVWSVPGGYAFPPLAEYNRWVTGAAYHPATALLAASGSDGTSAIIWDTVTGTGVFTLGGHAGGVSGVAWSPDGTLLAVGSESGVVYVYQVTLAADGLTVEDARQIYQLVGHDDAVTQLAFKPDSSLLATLDDGDRGRVIVWNVSAGQPIQEFEVGGRAYALAWAPGGDRLAVAQESALAVWDPDKGERQAGYAAGNVQFRSAAWLPDGVIATGTTAGKIVLLDGQMRELAVLEGHASPVAALAVSSDGALLVSGSSIGVINLWGIAP